MPLIKPPGDWSEELSSYYDGPPPTPGTYTGVVSYMGLGEIKNGDNAGQPKIVVSVEISHGKFKGAGIIASFPLLKQNAWSLNQFLMSMTDGSEAQKAGIRKIFYQGYHTGEEERKGLGNKITAIGPKGKFIPEGKSVMFVVEQNGEYANIKSFLVKQEGSGAEEPAEETSPVAEDNSESTGDLSGLDEFASAPEETAVAAEEPASDPDDPWG